MRNGFQRVNSVFHSVGSLLFVLSGVMLMPLVFVLMYRGQYGDGWRTALAFLVPAAATLGLGLLLRRLFRAGPLGGAGAMLFCSLSWLVFSALGALPFVIAMGSSYLNGCFEAMSGFTTTGITVFTGLDDMPRSVLFWRALTQWVGGVGILSFFLIITFRGAGAHHIFGAESHKISSRRPAPGLLNTVKILWAVYGLFTLLAIALLIFVGMSAFDSVCHALTGVSTGGFSPHDASIAHYRITGHPHWRLIEYTLVFIMMIGGINFLVHYRVITGDFKALRDNIEIRYWWGLLAGFTLIVMLDHCLRAPASPGSGFESVFRLSMFQVTSILTTTGFATRDIGSSFFPALSKQLFLVMMVIGGCVGSTSGGIKVLRVAILNRLMLRELFKARAPGRASTILVIDRKPVPDEETHRVAALFFAWILLLVVGGGITALLSSRSAWQSFSGMFSALGNIGPCYISVKEMIAIDPVVKIVYIFGMLAGRLEILPVLMLFSRRAWR